MYYFFSVKQNVKDIFIEGHRRKKQQKERDISKSIEKVKFHGYGTAKIEIQQQPGDINLSTCELHQTLFDILDFNPALKVINITLAYKNDENDIDFVVAEKKDELRLLMTSARELSAPTKKKVITGS